MAWELRIGGVSCHVTSYVYIRGDGVDGNVPPHMPIVTPGVLWNMFPDSEEHPLASSRTVPKVVFRWIRGYELRV